MQIFISFHIFYDGIEVILVLVRIDAISIQRHILLYFSADFCVCFGVASILTNTDYFSHILKNMKGYENLYQKIRSINLSMVDLVKLKWNKILG